MCTYLLTLQIVRGCRWMRGLFFAMALGAMASAWAGFDPAAALRAQSVALGPQLQQNQFDRPVVLHSTETANDLKGEIYALIDYPFDLVNVSLNTPAHWCDVMILHINVKYCRVIDRPAGGLLRVHIGRKTPEKLINTARIDFKYRVAAAAPDYVRIMLSAKEGPMGTSDYRIVFEAVALEEGKTFLHLTYSYAMNFSGRVAMQFYLDTLGSDKVGFTVTGRDAHGQREYQGGIRGLVERNTMRYYLAIDAFLGATGVEPAGQFEKRLQDCFSATEQYPRQLHETSRAAYVQMKRAEYARQR